MIGVSFLRKLLRWRDYPSVAAAIASGSRSSTRRRGGHILRRFKFVCAPKTRCGPQLREERLRST
jgi:hypothetical protein